MKASVFLIKPVRGAKIKEAEFYDRHATAVFNCCHVQYASLQNPDDVQILFQEQYTELSAALERLFGTEAEKQKSARTKELFCEQILQKIDDQPEKLFLIVVDPCNISYIKRCLRNDASYIVQGPEHERTLINSHLII